jgi:HD-GYP domain-containing protein (c-di-GMP phosphodiesterase class II)
MSSNDPIAPTMDLSANRQELSAAARLSALLARPYRGRMERADAMRELRQNAGTQVDVAVVEALLRVLGEA